MTRTLRSGVRKGAEGAAVRTRTRTSYRGAGCGAGAFVDYVEVRVRKPSSEAARHSNRRNRADRRSHNDGRSLRLTTPASRVGGVKSLLDDRVGHRLQRHSQISLRFQSKWFFWEAPDGL